MQIELPNNIFKTINPVALIQFGSRTSTNLNTSEDFGKKDLDFAIILNGSPSYNKFIDIKDIFNKLCTELHQKIPVYHGPVLFFMDEVPAANIILLREIIKSRSKEIYSVKKYDIFIRKFLSFYDKKSRADFLVGVLIEHLFEMRLSLFTHPLYSSVVNDYNSYLYHLGVTLKILLSLCSKDYMDSICDNLFQLSELVPGLQTVIILLNGNYRYSLYDYQERIRLHIDLCKSFNYILSEYAYAD